MGAVDARELTMLVCCCCCCCCCCCWELSSNLLADNLWECETGINLLKINHAWKNLLAVMAKVLEATPPSTGTELSCSLLKSQTLHVTACQVRCTSARLSRGKAALLQQPAAALHHCHCLHLHPNLVETFAVKHAGAQGSIWNVRGLQFGT